MSISSTGSNWQSQMNDKFKKDDRLNVLNEDKFKELMSELAKMGIVNLNEKIKLAGLLSNDENITAEDINNIYKKIMNSLGSQNKTSDFISRLNYEITKKEEFSKLVLTQADIENLLEGYKKCSVEVAPKMRVIQPEEFSKFVQDYLNNKLNNNNSNNPSNKPKPKTVHSEALKNHLNTFEGNLQLFDATQGKPINAQLKNN